MSDLPDLTEAKKFLFLLTLAFNPLFSIAFVFRSIYYRASYPRGITRLALAVSFGSLIYLSVVVPTDYVGRNQTLRDAIETADLGMQLNVYSLFVFLLLNTIQIEKTPDWLAQILAYIVIGIGAGGVIAYHLVYFKIL